MVFFQKTQKEALKAEKFKADVAEFKADLAKENDRCGLAYKGEGYDYLGLVDKVLPRLPARKLPRDVTRKREGILDKESLLDSARLLFIIDAANNCKECGNAIAAKKTVDLLQRAYELHGFNPSTAVQYVREDEQAFKIIIPNALAYDPYKNNKAWADWAALNKADKSQEPGIR